MGCGASSPAPAAAAPSVPPAATGSEAAPEVATAEVPAVTTSPADASAADAAPAPAEAVAASKPPADDASGLDAEADDVRATARSIADAAVASALEVSAETPEAGSDASTAPENSNAHLEEVLAADAAEWATLNAAGCAPFAGAQWTVGFIADQDEASASEAADGSKLYESTFSLGSLSYDVEAKAYTLGALKHSVVATKRGDKAGRGAEFSALEVLGARLLTFDDRTGAVDEIVKEGDGFAVQPLLDGAGEEVVCSLGDGSRPGKGLKCEWATLRDGALVVGSTGKERTDDEGNIVHEGEMWCKAINPETLAVTSVDARPLYNALRAKAKCPQGKGYMIHESGRWSDVHLRWFFMPRKLSREPYDEVRDASKCVSLLLAAKGDGAEATCIARSLEPALSFLPLRGASDFFFIPNTNDTHLFITRTEETLDNAVTTFASVIDLAGNVLMAEQEIARGCKFEGACVLDGWLSGEASEAPACTCQVM